MKKILVIALFSFLSTAAFAGTQVLSDIGHIANSSNVQNFIEQNNLKVESISYYPTSFCDSDPSSYVVKARNRDGKICDVWVMAGACADGNVPSNHEKVTVLITASEMKCQ